MEKPITIALESSAEAGILIEMLKREYLSSLTVDGNKATIKITSSGRKFLDKLINLIKQNAGK